MLTFIIPVRNPASVPDWSQVREFMGITFRSIAAQDCDDWQAVVVVNEGTALPDLPDKFRVVTVDIPLAAVPTHHDGDADTYNAVRDDKGARLWAGITAVRPQGHIMAVDYDDLVSRRLAGFVASHPDAPGWYVDQGYKYDGSPLLSQCERFNDVCGTSLIVRSDLLWPDPGEDEFEFVRYAVGSHRFLRGRLAARGEPMAPVPFRAAVYRVGHAHSYAGTKRVSALFSIREWVRRPMQVLGHLGGLRRLSPGLRHEFFFDS